MTFHDKGGEGLKFFKIFMTLYDSGREGGLKNPNFDEKFYDVIKK